MQFMVLVSLNPEKAQTLPPETLREAEFDAVRGLYMKSLIQQIWLRGDGSGACMIVEAPSVDDVAEKLGGLPMVRQGFLQPPTIVPLAPYWGFAPRS
jgi:hypothetical protein